MTQELARERAAQFNRIRESNQDKLFTGNMLRLLFKENGFPYSSRYLIPMKNRGVLIQIGNKIKFTSQPVHFSSIMEAVNDCNKSGRKRAKYKAHTSHTQANDEELIIHKANEDPEFTKQAIEYLKELGYKIMRPNVTWEEV